MNTAVLVMYIVVGGNMQTVRIPQPDIAACQAAAAQIAPAAKALHAECKVKKVKAA